MKAVFRDRWEETWQKLPARAVPQEVFDQLLRAYSSPGRFYHNIAHIQDCLSICAQAKSLAVHPEEVELAIWFHDAVYDTSSGDNEQKSAEWAESVIRDAGLNNEIAQRVSRSILATQHNTEVTDTDAQVVVDVDLSILGREPDVFWRYEESIRKEYARVPESEFRRKRVQILRGFLGRKHIYYHEKYREMFEQKARMNLKAALAKLSDTTGTPIE